MPDELPGDVIGFTGEIRARIRPTDGPRVLWIHGYTVDSTVWDDLWSLLPDWSHVGVDLPGHGASPPLELGATLPDLGRQLATAAIDWKIQHIVGLSLGSMIALQVALTYPRALETLTLAAPSLAGGPIEHDVGRRYLQLVELYRQRGRGPWMT